MRPFPLLLFSFLALLLIGSGPTNQSFLIAKNHAGSKTAFSDKDTCMIEGIPFKMYDYRSNRIMRAYIKNSQLFVVNDGLQFARFRIIQYVFSSLTDEYMPSFRWYNQRLSPPILHILKNAGPGQQFLFEDIVVVDERNTILANEVRPLVIERVKN
jgi:hypothetical protein